MIYYIHGYQSEPNSKKGLILKEKLGAIPIKYRDCEPEDIVIEDCVNRIIEQIKDDEDAILIGSSLGGLLAAKVAKKKKVKQLILLNPAIIPGNFDINRIEGIPKRILKEMQDKELFKSKIDTKISIIVGTKDDLIPNDFALEFAKAQRADLIFLEDDHSLTKSLEKLPDIIKKLILCQKN